MKGVIMSNFYLILMNGLIFILVSIVKSKTNNTFIKLFSLVHLITSIIFFTYLITDNIEGFIYCSLASGLLMYTGSISNSKFEIKELLVFIILILITSIMFIYVNRFSLVQFTTLMFVYFWPMIFHFRGETNTTIKTKLIGTLGLIIIMFSASISSFPSTTSLPTKQAIVASHFIEDNYGNVEYSIISPDTFRNQESKLRVYIDDNPVLYLVYIKGGIQRNE